MPKKVLSHNNYLLFSIVLFLLTACGGVQPLREVFKKQTPYEKYEQALKNARLENTALGQDWLEAGNRSLRDSLMITIPFRETGYFAAEKPVAFGYRLEARRGDRLVVQVETQSVERMQVFIDVFELDNSPSRSLKQVASADSTRNSLAYEVSRDRIHLIRVQPELLRSGSYTISVTREPTLAFPVPGKDSRNIASFWGADRDGGQRSHEGIDIFARRGTPALAATQGYIRGVNENRLGGKVVWLVDEKRRQTLYYAHLDSQLVQPGQRVMPGDTLGLIGNTGNARTTAPHLHFGIYSYGEGAIDPLPAVQMASPAPGLITASLEMLGEKIRTSAKKNVLRVTPNSKAPQLAELPRNTFANVIGATENWYRVVLPDGLSGYISAKSVEGIEKPVRSMQLKDSLTVLDHPDLAGGVITELNAGAKVPVLATFGSFAYVKTTEDKMGWILQQE